MPHCALQRTCVEQHSRLSPRKNVMSRKSDSGALSLSRRQLLKAAGLTLGAAAAGFSPFTSAQSPHRTLNILSWPGHADPFAVAEFEKDRKSTRLNSSHVRISYAVFCL